MESHFAARNCVNKKIVRKLFSLCQVAPSVQTLSKSGALQMANLKRQEDYILPRPYVTVGEYLQKMRCKAGLTQRQVGDALGYSSAQFISNFERGIALPPLAKLRVLMGMYKMDSRVLMDLILEVQREELKRELRVDTRAKRA
jgi:DNA-binding transcriptional regulator YiaG